MIYLFRMGFDPQSRPPFVTYGAYADQRGHAKDFEWICRPIQPASQASWSSFSESIQSSLCQEDPYLKELVRYIHLNPLRAKLVSGYKSLKVFRYAGHSTLMGKCPREWQNTSYILSQFGREASVARSSSSEFVEKGVCDGERPELVGGGLIRSLGRWAAAKAMREGKGRIKGDARILGDGDFVNEVSESCEQQLEQRYQYLAKGYDFDWLVGQAATHLSSDPEIVMRRSRYPDTVEARSVLCYWAARDLGISTLELAKRLGVSQPTASQSVKRGEKIVKEKGFKLIG